MPKLQNRDNSGSWPDYRHIGWSVATAGPVDLKLEYTSRSSVPSNYLPTGMRFLLKYIDDSGYAWVYRDDYGVVRLPKELLVAWDR